MRRLLFALCIIMQILAHAQERDEHGFNSVKIWTVGSEWEVFFEPEHDEDGTLYEKSVRYRLGRAEDGYMTLDKTEYTNGMEGDTVLIGYIRNESDTMIYVRPIRNDGSIGEECLLYDFSTPFEYGETIRYGLQDGTIEEEYIDWQRGTLQYYVLNGDTHLLPSWDGIIYRYGYIGGPMELFQCSQAPHNKKVPKATNISHVIFSTKGGRKVPRIGTSPETDFEVCISYQPMLTDGIKWECLAVSKRGFNGFNGSNGFGETYETYTVEVKGDTVIGNRTCKLVYSPEFCTSKIAFEEGRKLYTVNADNEPEVLQDFSLEQDVIDDTPWCSKLLEGIGVSTDEYFREHCIQSEDDDVISYMLRCWKDNVLVYQAPFHEAATGINRISAGNDSSIYDLQGRRLHSVPERGIYIINGNKKKVIK